MKISGSCHCGYIIYEGEADPERVSLCHCTDCQKSTGTAFRVNVPVAAANFKMSGGQPTIYLKTTADSGNPRVQAFCPKCGTPLYSTSPGDNPETYIVRIGTLDQRDQLMPKSQNWFHSAQPWLTAMSALRTHQKSG
jgi:hypothetical protein